MRWSARRRTKHRSSRRPTISASTPQSSAPKQTAQMSQKFKKANLVSTTTTITRARESNTHDSKVIILHVSLSFIIFKAAILWLMVRSATAFLGIRLIRAASPRPRSARLAGTRSHPQWPTRRSHSSCSRLAASTICNKIICKLPWRCNNNKTMEATKLQ